MARTKRGRNVSKKNVIIQEKITKRTKNRQLLQLNKSLQRKLKRKKRNMNKNNNSQRSKIQGVLRRNDSVVIINDSLRSETDASSTICNPETSIQGAMHVAEIVCLDCSDEEREEVSNDIILKPLNNEVDIDGKISSTLLECQTKETDIVCIDLSDCEHFAGEQKKNRDEINAVNDNELRVQNSHDTMILEHQNEELKETHEFSEKENYFNDAIQNLKPNEDDRSSRSPSLLNISNNSVIALDDTLKSKHSDNSFIAFEESFKKFINFGTCNEEVKDKNLVPVEHDMNVADVVCIDSDTSDDCGNGTSEECSHPPKKRRKKKNKSNINQQKCNFTKCVQIRSQNSIAPECNINDDVHNILGDNFYNAGCIKKTGLRPIIVDGSNVALGHSNNKRFSVRGLAICIDYFLKRGHKVRAFVPHYRTKYNQSSDPSHLRRLCDLGLVILTPSRQINGKNIVSYDDRFIVQSAAELGGIIVSCDNFRDLMQENQNLIPVIEKQLLMFTWIDDMIIFPNDPLGRNGPDLNTFLRFP